MIVNKISPCKYKEKNSSSAKDVENTMFTLKNFANISPDMFPQTS